MLHIKRHHVKTPKGALFFFEAKNKAEQFAKETGSQYLGFLAVPREHLLAVARDMWPNVPAFADTVQRMKREILLDIASGRVSSKVVSFSELHDYVDANCYGGFCEENGITDALIQAFGGRDDNEGMPDGAVEYINDAQNAVHAWLVNGRKD